MGVQITDLLVTKDITLESLKGKKIAIDAFNFIYQFITTLRTPDGKPLSDSQGRMTSHLVGILSRTTKLMELGIQCVFVFDGEPPALKEKERLRRHKIKEQAQTLYNKAIEDEDSEAMKKYASRLSFITPDMIEDAKKLLEGLGIPVVQAPSEAEAQAAYMVKKGIVDFVASQDTDCLLFGAPVMIRNLSIAGKRKKTNKLAFEVVNPITITLSDVLNSLGIDYSRFIALGMLVGTDFNVGGIKGIGPKNAIKLVKQYQKLDELFTAVKWNDFFSYPWQEVHNLFTQIPVIDTQLTWNNVNREKLSNLLLQYDFSQERIDGAIKKLIVQKDTAQKGLGSYFT